MDQLPDNVVENIDSAWNSGTGGTPSRNTKSRAWGPCTWNNYPDNYADIIKGCGGDYVFQTELGSTGNIHIQFGVKFANPRSFEAVKKLFPGAHIEPSNNWPAVVNYCKKVDSRVAEGECSVDKPVCRDVFKVKSFEYKPWQKEIIAELDTDAFDTRVIHWYWEDKGGVGKSTFTKHLCLKYGAIIVSGKQSDMFAAIAAMEIKPKVVVVDIPRTGEAYVSYGGIEKIKDGCFFSSKYESGMVLFDNPHIVCFANFPPETSTMSADRWHIVKIE